MATNGTTRRGEGATNIIVSDDAGDVEDLNPDPNHEFAHVTLQISSTGDPVGNPDMKGFVRDYFEDCKDAVHAAGIMKCFTPQTLPILSTLATQYAVCDRWFSSVPGSTIPNRLFVHAASSAGSLTQDVVAAPFAVHTIFESFDDTTSHDFAIYTNGSSVLFANKYLIQNMDKFHNYANFVVDATSGNLPAYTFIEPAYDDDGEGTFASSQHPDFPVDRGEALIREIYYALTKSPDWKSTLFLILYDEHGGIFDHVSPPIVTRNPIYNSLPDVEHSGLPDVFDFTRLGVRVPAVFVSPCIPPNTVINDQDYDHCSVVSTVRKLFCNPASKPLNWREAQAATSKTCSRSPELTSVATWSPCPIPLSPPVSISAPLRTRPFHAPQPISLSSWPAPCSTRSSSKAFSRPATTQLSLIPLRCRLI